MKHGEEPHPDIIELRVRLYIEDPDRDRDAEELKQSAQAIFQTVYLARLDMYTPAIAEIQSIELFSAGPPDDYTPPPDDNIADN